MKITAVHYSADSSGLATGHDRQGHINLGMEEGRPYWCWKMKIFNTVKYFAGNNKVKLNKNEYIHWQPADWHMPHGMDRYFTMDSTGVLTVKDHGLFLIYAQVKLNWCRFSQIQCCFVSMTRFSIPTITTLMASQSSWTIMSVINAPQWLTRHRESQK